jgi:hypothetical protein
MWRDDLSAYITDTENKKAAVVKLSTSSMDERVSASNPSACTYVYRKN